MRILKCWFLAIVAALAAAAQAPAPPAPAPNGLSDSQKQMVKAAEKELAAKIAPLAEKLARTAKDLDRVLLADKPDPDAERKLGDELAAAVADIVAGAIRLRVQALHGLVATLTPEQKKLLLAELEKPGANPDLLELMKKVFPEKNK